MKKNILNLAVIALVTAAFAGQASAQTATQVVSFEVAGISEIAMSGSPSLVINDATPGFGLTPATASGTYAITTNQSNRKITAQIDTNMPSFVELSVSLAAPTGATSAGTVLLNTVAQDVVTGITTVDEPTLSIGYGLSADEKAGVVPAGNKTVTYTITAGA